MLGIKQKQAAALTNYKKLGNSSIYVSPLCLGTMMFGSSWSTRNKICDIDEVEAIFDRYISLGGNFIDMANKYQEGVTESWMGDLIKKNGNREHLILATKYSLPLPSGNVNFCGNHRKNMIYSLERSLERLKLNYIDIYYVHFWDHSTPEIEIMRSLDDLVRSGKVMNVGISDTPAWEVARCNTLAEQYNWIPFTVYQGQHSIENRSMERDIIPMCRHLKLGVTPWSIINYQNYNKKSVRNMKKYSMINNLDRIEYKDNKNMIREEVSNIAEEIKRTPCQVILNWQMQQPVITSPVINVESYKALKENLEVLEFKLDKKQINRLNRAASFDLGYPLSIIGMTYEESPFTL